MTTGVTSLTIKPRKGEPITEGSLAYQRARTQLRMHSMLLEAFARSGMKKSELARMLDKKPEVVNRILGEAANYNLDTLSDFLLALCGCELSDDPQEIREVEAALPAWLKPQPLERPRQTSSDNDAFTIIISAGSL